MHLTLAAIEQNFRSKWGGFDPNSYAEYLNQVPEEHRRELLVRLLCAELEYLYQPPSRQLRRTVERAALLTHDGGTDSANDDERIRPSVQLFWLRFPELQRDEGLLIRLIVLEYALRLRHDQLPPNPESYIGFCEGSSQERLAKLLELTEARLPQAHLAAKPSAMISHSDSTVKDAHLPSQVHVEPLPTHFGAFLLIRLIGRGGMGIVYAAIDLRSTARVAIKVMRRVDAWSVFRFFEEFRWLSQLEHPNLVKLFNAYTEEESRYFSMELVEGHTIANWFRGLSKKSNIRWTLLRKVLSQLASAINYLHENRVLHCDIKCSNLMITHRARAVLLDLGLAVREGNASQLVGTLQYMAPELLNRDIPTRESDWYSFGITMYEVMSGKSPAVELSQDCSGRAIYKVDRARLRQDLAGCPEDLQRLCLSLIDTNPANRPAAAHTLAVLGEATFPRLKTTTVYDCPGREKEIGQLHQALISSHTSDRRYVIVHGESGIGKTRLIESWRKSIDPATHIVIAVHCYQQDHTPNRLLNAVIQELLSVLGNVPDVFWRPALIKRRSSMCELFPQVTQLLDDMAKPLPITTTGAIARKECFRALADWLQDISQHRHMVVVVDNAQWADQDSTLELMALRKRPSFNGLVVLSDDSDAPLMQYLQSTREEIGAPLIKIEQESVSIPVLPLSRAVCEDLLDAWSQEAGISVSDVAAERLIRFSGGNPFLLRELSNTYFSDFGAIADAAVSLIGNSEAQNTVRRRFASLPPVAELTLEFIAVANHALGFYQLQMLTRVMPQELLRTISLLRSQGWVRSGGGGADSDFVIAHDRFRKAILQGIPEDRMIRRHSRIARTLSHESPAPWSRIAGHYWAANRIQEASTCYMQSARDAFAAGAIEEALFFLGRATHPSAVRTSSESLELKRLQADCLSCNGSSRAAAELYEYLASRASGDEQVLLSCLAGEQWIRAGQPESGITLLKEPLRSMNIHYRTAGAFTRFSLLGRALQLSFGRRAKCIEQESAPFSEIHACLNRIASPLTYLENRLGQELILKMNQKALETGSLQDRSEAVLRTAVVLSFAGRRWRGIAVRRLHVGRQLAYRSGRDSALAIWNFCMFVWYIQKNELGRAVRHGQQSIRRFASTRERFQWEQQFLSWGVLCCYFFSNDLKKLREATGAQRESATRRNDPMSSFWSHVAPAHWSDLVADEVLSGRKSLVIAQQAIANFWFQLPRFFLWLSQIFQYLYEGDAEAAQRVLNQDWDRVARSKMLKTNHYRWLALQARVCCELLSAKQDPLNKTRWMNDARRTARRMLLLEEPGFIVFGRSMQLVINAMEGKIAARSCWECEISELKRFEHHLAANALAWHYWLYQEDCDANVKSLRAQFSNQGCVNPERLMNLVMPLPDVPPRDCSS